MAKPKRHTGYSALNAAESNDYSKVKCAILKAYELVPEAYRQKFRNCRKTDTQTYTEYASEKEISFARWCRSQEISEDFEKLSQLILIEEFKWSISS